MTVSTAEESSPSPIRGSEVPARRARYGRRRRLLPLLLLLASVVTTAGSGARLMANYRFGLAPLVNERDLFPLGWIWRHPAALGSGWSFSLALLVILLAHELGHFIYCGRHGILVSWPWVLPAPTLSGTAGAVIRIRSRIPSRRSLLEVGIAGPIAGYVASVAAACVGLLLSKPAAPGGPQPLVEFHQPLTVIALHKLIAVFVPGLPSLQRFSPHPVLLASWIGFLLTSLNLIPAGQLDGGHILYALSPEWHRRTTYAVPALLLLMGVTLWTGWLLWGGILLLPAMRHPRVPQYPPPPPRYRRLGLLAAALLVLSALPAPFGSGGLIDLFR